LIVHTQTAENRTADTKLMSDALPQLKARTELQKMVTDGGYVGPEIDQAMRRHEVEQITTGLTGTLPDHQDGKLALSDFEMGLSREGEVIQATCPAGCSATIQPTPSGKSFRLLFEPSGCQACAFFQQRQCPVQINPKKGRCFLTVPKDRASSSQRRRRFERCKEEARNLRPAVEATVFQVKHTLRGGKLRVRGLFRVACAFTCAALAVNVRRISRYENDKQRGKYTSRKARAAVFSVIFTSLEAWFAPCYRLPLGFRTCFSC
jgi:Transposase DDE domain